MSVEKLTFNDKTNLYPFVDRARQMCAEDINELKTKFNDNIDENFNRSNIPQLGYKLLADDFDFASIPADYDNSIWEIRKVYDLEAGAVALPENVTLKFIGGKLTNYGIITGDNTKILAGFDQIFDASGTLAGTWKIDKAYPQWFGATGNGVDYDTVALQKTLDLGGTVYIPDGTYLFSLITVSKNNTELKLSNNAIFSSTANLSNAIEVTGNNCTINGGTLEMSDDFDGTNSQWTYANIFVTGYNVSIKNMTLNNVQKVGIGFSDTYECFVHGCTIIGNYGGSWTGIQTAHFGIAFNPGGSGNTFVATDNYIKSCVQGIFFGNYGAATDETGIFISNNNITDCFNHAVYCSGGKGQIISNNQIYNCGFGIATLCPYGANVSNNMIYLGKSDPALSDEVGISLRDPVNVICNGNNIVGKGSTNGAALILTSINYDTISDNIVTGNIIKLDNDSVCDVFHLGSASATEFMHNNIISDNIIEGQCLQFHGALYVRSKLGATCYSNVIKNNHVKLNITHSGDAAIYVYQAGGMIIKNNDILLTGNLLTTSAAYGIYLPNSADGEAIGNKISMFAGNGANINFYGIRIDVNSGFYRVEQNKLDASLSDALSYLCIFNADVNAQLSKNLNDSRIASYGQVTVLAGTRIGGIPYQNLITASMGDSRGSTVTNVNVRPLNQAATAEVLSQVLDIIFFSTTAELILPLNVASDCIFGWEIV